MYQSILSLSIAMKSITVSPSLYSLHPLAYHITKPNKGKC